MLKEVMGKQASWILLLFLTCTIVHVWGSHHVPSQISVQQENITIPPGKMDRRQSCNISNQENLLEDSSVADIDAFVPESLNGTLRVAVSFAPTNAAIKEPLYKVHYPDNVTLQSIHGTANIAYAFMLDMQVLFNFKLQVIPSVGWIQEGQNGSITGVGYQVASGEADVGIDISKPAAYRAKRLTFLHAIKQDHLTIAFRQPSTTLYRNILSRPFKHGLWICGVVSWLVLILSAALIISTRQKNFTLADFHDILLPITATFLARSISIAALLTKKKEHLRKACSVRVVIIVVSMFGFTMYSIYSAFIVSSLRRFERLPIRKFNDLVENDYELMAQNSLPDFTNVFVKDAKLGHYYTRTAKSNFISMDNVMKRLFGDTTDLVGNGDEELDEEIRPVAYFTLKSDFHYVAKQHGYSNSRICQIANLNPKIRQEHPRLLAMFIAKRNATLREALNRKILRILNRGLGHRHVVRFEKKFEPKCHPRRRTYKQQVRFYDVYAAYYVLGGGACLALCVWGIIEVIIPFVWNLHQEKKREKYRAQRGLRNGNWGNVRHLISVQSTATSGNVLSTPLP